MVALNVPMLDYLYKSLFNGNYVICQSSDGYSMTQTLTPLHVTEARLL